MGNTRLWAEAFRVVHVAVAALAVVVVVFLADAVMGEGTLFAMMVPLSLVFATFVWTMLAGALVAFSFVDLRRKNMIFTLIGAASLSFWMAHLAVAALAIVVVVFLADIFIQGARLGMSDPFSWVFVALVWTVLAGALVALSFIDRRRKNMTLTLIGAASSAFVFVGAVACAPSLYGRDLRPFGWYALLATSVPLLMFAGILLRDAPLSSRLPYFRHGLIAGAFLALAAGMALQMKVGASANGFGRELGASLDTGEAEIHFSEITDFEWDLVEIYGPYTSKGMISEAAREGVDVITLSQVVRMNENFSLVVFMDEDRVVYYEIVPRTVAGIHDPDNRNPIVRRYGEARARVEHQEGWPFPLLWFE